MGKQFRRTKDGGEKPKRPKTGFGLWGIGAVFAGMLALVGITARRESAAR